MKKYIVILWIALFVFSCNSDDENADSEMSNVAFTLIAKDNLYGNGDEGIVAQNMVITNQNSWNDLITQMNSVNNVSDNFSEMDIDFSQYIVIAVFDEIQGEGGHSLEMSIESNSENILVNITDIVPQGNATTVITQPFIIVKIANSNLPILFQ